MHILKRLNYWHAVWLKAFNCCVDDEYNILIYAQHSQRKSHLKFQFEFYTHAHTHSDRMRSVFAQYLKNVTFSIVCALYLNLLVARCVKRVHLKMATIFWCHSWIQNDTLCDSWTRFADFIICHMHSTHIELVIAQALSSILFYYRYKYINVDCMRNITRQQPIPFWWNIPSNVMVCIEPSVNCN